MFLTTLWVAGPILESLLVVRALRGRFLKEYKFFYFYLLWVLVRDLSLLAIYHKWSAGYSYFYWYSEFFSVLVGCGVVWELYRLSLTSYPGAARMARSVLLFLFIVTMTRVLVDSANKGRWFPGQTTLETEREFRIVQFSLLAGLIALLVHYSIPIGRNVKGILVGYAAFLATTLVQLTMRNQLGERFQVYWQYIQPASYVLILVLWCYALWSFAPTVCSPTEGRMERDYQAIANATKEKLKEARSYVGRAVRP